MSSSILEESKKAKRKGILGIFKNKKIMAGALIVVVIGGSFYYFRNRGQSQVNTVVPKNWTVRNGDIQIAIDTDGKVVAEDGVELSFSVSGDNLEVSDVYVNEGQQVKKGDKIASVKTDTLEYSVRTAYSSYQSALAAYNEKIAGPTDDDIAKAKASIEQAQISLDQSKISRDKTKVSGEDKVRAAQDAVKTAKDNLNMNQSVYSSQDVDDAYQTLVDTVKSTDLSLEGILRDSDEVVGVDNSLLNDAYEKDLGTLVVGSLSAAQGSYTVAKRAQQALDTKVIGLSYASPYADIDAAVQLAQAALDAFDRHLYDMQNLLSASVATSNLTQTKLDGFKSSVSSNRTSVNTKTTAINNNLKTLKDAKDGLDDYVTAYNDALRDLDNAKVSADQDNQTADSNVRTRELSLEDAQRSYDDLMAPMTDAEMAAARSSLTSASVNLERAKLDLEKATILSPIDGQIAQLNYKQGDIITDNTKSVATVINNDTLYIEVNIEEADISKIKVGDKAVATFDALNSAEIPGEISFISLTSGSSNNGIVTYLVRVLLDNSDKKNIREGMTAGVKFVTAGVSNVLMVPVEAVRNVDGKPSVQMDNGEWQPVVTGFTDGKYVEVINGLSEGDKLVY